jgi:hypothetical protein
MGSTISSLISFNFMLKLNPHKKSVWIIRDVAFDKSYRKNLNTGNSDLLHGFK